MANRPPSKTFLDLRSDQDIRPFRLQYTMAEAAYMLCIKNGDTVREWADRFGIQVYKIKESDGKWFIKHNDLVRLLAAAVDTGTYDLSRVIRHPDFHGPTDYKGMGEYQGTSDYRSNG